MQKLLVQKAIGATFAFIIHHWSDVVRIVWAPVAVLIGGSFLLSFALSGLQTGVAAVGTPEAALAAISTVMPLLLGAGLLYIYVFLAIYAGLLKLLIRGERPSRPFYLGFGADEARLLGCFLILFLIMFGVYLGAAVVAGFIASLAATLTGSDPIATRGVSAILIIFVLGVCAWFGARLFLAAPATVALGRIGVGPSWSRSAGATLPLFFYLLFWTGLAALLEAGYVLLAVPGYFHFLAIVLAGQTPEPSDVPQGAPLWSLSWMLDVSLSYVVTFLTSIFGVTASGVAWRLLTDQDQTRQL